MRRGSIFKQHSLIWKNINIVANSTSKQIIENANGQVHPGEMCAIMGSSGAGKTTLLNSLANRNIGSGISQSGQILANSHLIDNHNFYKNISAYCQQQDLFLGQLTVEEHLLFHARLRNVENPQSRVDKVLKEMNLQKVRNSKIGSINQDKTLSGGEKKRLSFATQILIQPAILFADEPTSGLDTKLAKTVISSLRNIAEQGTSILCTIHQPNSEIFQMFDKILLLSHGRTIYFGPSKHFVLEYFKKTLDLHCPENYNPADFLISKISVDQKSEADAMAEKFLEFSSKNRRNKISPKVPNSLMASGFTSAVDSAAMTPVSEKLPVEMNFLNITSGYNTESDTTSNSQVGHFKKTKNRFLTFSHAESPSSTIFWIGETRIFYIRSGKIIEE